MNETIRPYRVLADPGTDHDAWLEARKAGIGSSDAPSILGLTSWGSPITVAASKIGDLPEEEKDVFFWGHALEPIILARYSQKTGRPVEHYGCCVQSVAQPFLCASPDGLQNHSKEEYRHDADILGPGIAEAKLVGHKAHEWRDGPPNYVWTQVQHQMMVTEFQWATVVALLRGVELKWWDILRDDQFIEEILRPACVKFWDIVQQNDLSLIDVDDKAQTTAALKRIYPEDSGVEVDLDDDLLANVERLDLIKIEEKKLGQAKRGIQNMVLASLGAATVGHFSDGRSVTHRVQTRKPYTVKEAKFKVLRFTGAR